MAWGDFYLKLKIFSISPGVKLILKALCLFSALMLTWMLQKLPEYNKWWLVIRPGRDTENTNSVERICGSLND